MPTQHTFKEAMDAGGMGYILKSSANEELRARSRRSSKGSSTSLLHLIGMSWKPCTRPVRGRARAPTLLTSRQAEILQLVAEGWGNKEIADLFKVSVKTVDFHRGRIMRKLGAHNVAELVRYAVQAGMVGV